MVRFFLTDQTKSRTYAVRLFYFIFWEKRWSAFNPHALLREDDAGLSARRAD